MDMSERTTAILLIAVVALGAVTGVAAADGDLGVTVDDADGEPTVEVTENDTAVANATVLVSVVDEDDENASYAGAGEYETDANGTVELLAAEQDVTVKLTAAAGNGTASTTVELEAPDGLELEADDTDDEPVVTVTDDDGTSDILTETIEVRSEPLFTEPLPGFNSPPQNTGDLDPNLYEDLNGDGDGLDPSQTVTLWTELVVNPQDFDDLTKEQVEALDWNGDGQLTPSDAVELWTEQVLAN